MPEISGKPRARAWTLAFLAFVSLTSAISKAQQTTPFTEVHTVATASQAVPLEYTLNVAVPGAYNVTLVDLGSQFTPQAPLASVQLAITSGGAVVGTAMSAAGTAQFTLAQGSYVIHLIGQPGPIPGSGPVGVQVADGTGNIVLTTSDTLALPGSTLPSNIGTTDGSFTVTTGGPYTVALNDLSLPALLAVKTLLLIPVGGLQPAAILPDPNTAATQVTVSLAPGDYRLFAVAEADPAVGAGLYSATVAPAGGGNPVFATVQPVGSLQSIGTATLAVGAYNLAVADLAYPGALTQLGAAAINSQGQVVAQLGAVGMQPFTTTASDTYRVYGFGALSGGSGAGSFAVSLQATGSPAALNVARAVTAAGSPIATYDYDTTVLSAGAYTLDLVDFKVPAQLASIGAVVAQAGALVGTPLTTVPGSRVVTLTAGPVSVLVFAQAASSGGLFGLDLTPGGGGAPVFETTQGVGQLFVARKVSVTSPGNYGVAIADVSFPKKLQSFDVIVTQGTTSLGSIFGGGNFTFTAATGGNYFLNFVAQPDGTAGAGTYFMTVAAAPTVTLTSSAPQVGSGGTVTLTWSSQNASSCAASDGWSGNQALSGSSASAALNAATTFTLTCMGANGFTSKASVNVAVAQADSGGKSGGGGALGGDLLLLAAVLICRLNRRIQNHVHHA